MGLVLLMIAENIGNNKTSGSHLWCRAFINTEWQKVGAITRYVLHNLGYFREGL